ncbi:unnamed protein product, partial [Porites evermanni]
GIKCYQCTSTKSWDDCVPGKNTTCPPESNTCAKLDIELEEQGQATKKFQKACVVKSKCNEAGCKLAGLFGVKVTKCDVNCCHSDLCNGVKVPMASSFLFCYQCKSLKSWDACVPGNDTLCPDHDPSQNNCLKVKIEGEKDGKNMNYFAKSCVEKDSCNLGGCKAAAQLLGMKFKDCVVNCCDTDLCNGAKVTMVSSFLFLACALVANFR